MPPCVLGPLGPMLIAFVLILRMSESVHDGLVQRLLARVLGPQERGGNGPFDHDSLTGGRTRLRLK